MITGKCQARRNNTILVWGTVLRPGCPCCPALPGPCPAWGYRDRSGSFTKEHPWPRGTRSAPAEHTLVPPPEAAARERAPNPAGAESSS